MLYRIMSPNNSMHINVLNAILQLHNQLNLCCIFLKTLNFPLKAFGGPQLRIATVKSAKFRLNDLKIGIFFS